MIHRTYVRGGILGGLLLLFLGISWLCFGLGAAWDQLTHRTPVETTLADYNAGKVEGKRFRLKDCQVELEEAVYETQEKDETKVDAVYVPVHVPGDDTTPMRVYIKDDSYIPIVRAVLTAGNEEQTAKVIEKYADRFTETKTFEGWIVDTPKLLKQTAHGKRISPDYVVLDPKGREWGLTITFLVLGLLAVLGGIRSLVKRG